MSDFIVRGIGGSIFTPPGQNTFISNDVAEYVFTHLPYTTDVNEIKGLVDIYNKEIDKNNVLVNQFTFHALVRCKCSVYVETLQKALKLKGGEIEAMGYDVFHNKFKDLFTSRIYTTSIRGVFILHLLSLKNGDIMFLINNCFVHASISYSNEFNLSSYDVSYLNQCMKMMKESGIGFNNFYLISYYPDEKKRFIPGLSNEKCYFKGSNKCKFDGELKIKYYITILDCKNYFYETILSFCNNKIEGVNTDRNLDSILSMINDSMYRRHVADDEDDDDDDE